MRRWLRLGALAAAVLTCAAALLLGLGYLLAPGVGQAEARARAIAVGHGGSDSRAGVTRTRVARAVVAIEDRRFYDHGAVDPIALARATWSRVTGAQGDPGGSTIAQQLARLLYGQRAGGLGAIQDTLVAFKLESHYSKREILEMYLTSAYFGQGAYGAAQAAITYFHKPVASLDWAEASMLAGLPQAPSAFDPVAHFAKARARQREVLQAVVRAHLLSQTRADAAFRELRSLSA